MLDFLRLARSGVGVSAASVPSPAAPTLAQAPLAETGQPPGGGGWRSHVGSLLFLAPGGVWLAIIAGYPVVATVIRSLFDQSGGSFIALGNYQRIFSSSDILIAFRNNVIWVIVFPFIVTFLGLVFAVLTERIRWSTAFKAIIFMPIVFSLTASALIWRAMFDLDPHIGMVNAAVQTVSDLFNPPGPYPVDPSTGQTVSALAATGVSAGSGNTLVSSSTASAGDVVQYGIIGISPSALQTLGAQPATLPASVSGSITGVVWRDFSPTHATSRGQIFPDEDGLPDLHLSLLRADGSVAGTATTATDGTFRFDNVGQGSFHVQIDANNFQSGYTGTFFLGTQSLTPTSSLNKTAQALLSVPIVDVAMIIAMLWIWAGFAMVVIGAGLASLNREVLEAAQVDGANGWQTFRRVTMPMLQPVLIVVLVTMVINVLKIFDIILNMPPGSSVGDAATLALQMYNVGFAVGGGDQGLASALAVILFVLVVPAIIFNMRRIQG
jgi:alpha-glucoside transport system permease protein